MTQSRIKRLLAVTLCLTLALGLFGFEVPATAATTRTTTLDLSTNQTISYSGGNGSGNPTTASILDSDEGWKWYLTAAEGHVAKTLVLDGINLVTPATAGVINLALILPAGSTIVLNGDNTVTAGNASAQDGVTPRSIAILGGTVNGNTPSESGSLTIKGDGTLNVTSGNAPNQTVAILAGTLNLNGGTVVCKSGNPIGAYNTHAIYASSVTINGAQVTATGGTQGTYRNGVFFTSSLTFIKGSLTATSGEYGIRTAVGKLTINANAQGTFTASGTDGAFVAATPTGGVALNGHQAMGAATKDATELVEVAYDGTASTKTFYIADSSTIAKKVVIDTAPSITVGQAQGQLIGGVAGTTAYDITAKNLQPLPQTYDVTWYDDATITTPVSAPTGITSSYNDTTKTLTMTGDGNQVGKTYYFEVSSGTVTSKRTALKVLSSTDPYIVVGDQEGKVYAGETDVAKYELTLGTFTDDPDFTAVTWTDKDGKTATPPAGVTVGYESLPTPTLSLTGGATTAAGTYYFTLAHEGTTSNVAKLTVSKEADDLTVSLKAGDAKVTVEKQTTEAGHKFYHQHGTTSGTRPDQDSTFAPAGWTEYSADVDITGLTNGQKTFVRVAKVETSTNQLKGWGEASATPMKALSVKLAPEDGKLVLAPQTAETGFTYYYKSSDQAATKPNYDDVLNTADWAPYDADADIAGANGTKLFVQVAKVDDVETKVKAWGEASATPIASITVSLTAGNAKVTLTAPTGGGTYYYKSTATDDTDNKPEYGSTDLSAWTELTGTTENISGTNGTKVYVQLVEVDVDKIVAWGQGDATPKADDPPPPGPIKGDPVVKPDGGKPLDPVVEAGDTDPVSIGISLSGANVANGLELTCTIGGVTATATATENGKVSFMFPAGALNGLKEGEYDIVISSPGDANNNAFETVVGKLTVEPAGEVDTGIDVLAVRKGKALVLPKFKGYSGTWSVKDDSIAKITKKGNKVKALALGTVKLVYKVDAAPKKALMLNDRELKPGGTYEITLNVRKAGELVTKIALDRKKLSLSTVGTNNTAKLTATVKPVTALDREVFWTSTDPKVATVDEHGNVTAIGAGKCKIVAVSASLKRASATVTVTGAISVKPAKKTIKVGKELTLTATLADGIDGRITWSSGNPDAATVDENGVVTAVAKGKAIITATAANGETATCVVTVKKK